MSIIIDGNTRVVVRGITGKEGGYWTEKMQAYGTQIVAGVSPGKGGATVSGIPVYSTVEEALREHTADASMLFIPPRAVKDAVLADLAAGIRTVVVTAEGVPLYDALEIRRAALALHATVIGSNTTGVISLGKAAMGFFPYWIERIYRRGNVGVMTRSGSLTNEVTAEIVKAGFGVTSIVGVGGDSVTFTRFAELLPLFEADPETHAVVMIGEIGGSMEEEVASEIAAGRFTKPLVASLGGRTAPAGTRMGHAGAIINGSSGTVQEKIRVLQAAGAMIAERPSAIGGLLRSVI